MLFTSSGFGARRKRTTPVDIAAMMATRSDWLLLRAKRGFKSSVAWLIICAARQCMLQAEKCLGSTAIGLDHVR